MPEPVTPGDRRPERTAAERSADHAAIDRLADELLPALIAKLGATGLGELEVREGGWRVRLRRPGDGPAPAPSARAAPGRARACRSRPAPAPARSRQPTGMTPVGPGRDGRDAAARDGAGGRDGATAATARSATTAASWRPRRPSASSSRGRRRVPGPRSGPATGSARSTCSASPQEVVAPSDGVVGASLVEPGDAVEYGQELIVIEFASAVGARRPDRVPQGPHRQPRRDRAADPARLPRRSASRRSSPTARRTATRSPVQLADEAICIGPADARRSYLSAPAVISAALVTGCDAIHPGYGFLSEDEGFAEVVAAHDLTFIGPPAARPRAVRQQGRHAPAARRPTACRRSRARTGCCATRCTPSARPSGSATRSSSSRRPAAAARACAWSARRASSNRSLRVCRSEAKAAFGDDSLYLEKWLDENRHVEVQVAVDRYGHGVHLGERDCSVQRRHQKILEEAPTPALVRTPPGPTSPSARSGPPSRPATRTSARSSSSSTRTGDFYFIEINCRIQVEHPVTEMLTGHRPRGDPDPDRRRRAARLQPGRRRRSAATPSSSGSTPRTRSTSSGRAPASSSATTRRAARASAWTRTCTAATRSRRSTTRSSASSSSGARTGATAIARGRVALDELVVDGLVTNVAIHQALLANEAFLEGRMTTNLLDRVGSAAFLAAAARS